MKTTHKLFLVLLAFGTLSAEAHPRDGGRYRPNPRWGLEVISATYGGNCGAARGNATYDVDRFCRGGNDCVYTVDVNRIGDPAYGCRKDFLVEYACPGERRPQQAYLSPEANGQTALMDCGRGGGGGRYGINIGSATYGGNQGARYGNATSHIKLVCEGLNRCRYDISVSNLGDPVPGRQKDFMVTWTCGDRYERRAYAPPEAHGRSVDLDCR